MVQRGTLPRKKNLSRHLGYSSFPLLEEWYLNGKLLKTHKAMEFPHSCALLGLNSFFKKICLCLPSPKSTLQCRSMFLDCCCCVCTPKANQWVNEHKNLTCLDPLSLRASISSSPSSRSCPDRRRTGATSGTLGSGRSAR